MAANVGISRVLLLGTDNSDGSVTGVTTGTTAPILAAGASLITIFLRSLGSTSGGTILIEEADWGPQEAPYSGTWSQLNSIAASTFTGGTQLAVHVTSAALRYFRVRISSPITGGGSVYISMAMQGF